MPVYKIWQPNYVPRLLKTYQKESHLFQSQWKKSSLQLIWALQDILTLLNLLSFFIYLFIFFFPSVFFFFLKKKTNCFYVVFQPFFTFYFELVSSMRFKNPFTIDFDVVQTFSGLNLLIQGICKHVAKIFRMYVRKFSKRALPPSPELDLPFDEMVHPN